MNINYAIGKLIAWRSFLCFIPFIWHWDAKAVIAHGTSYDEELSFIVLRDNCSTVEPIESYSFRNGETEGVLYAIACRHGNSLPSPLVDYVKYKFIDTGGTNSERCYGIVDTSTPSGIMYSWEYLGAVPGYSCSKINRTIHKLFPKGY